MPKTPIRTCKGCGKRNNQSELFRFVVSSENIPVHDRSMTMEGRGVYCCRNERCIRSLCTSRKKLSRAFRQEIAGGFKIDLLLESGSFK